MKTIKTCSAAFLLIMLLSACSKDETQIPDIDYRQEMRDLIMEIAAFAQTHDPDFMVIPQNGQELATENGEPDGILQSGYLQSIDATGREDLFYGYTADNERTPQEETDYLLALCQLFEENNVELLTTDYCSSPGKMDSSYILNENQGFISFAANERDLNNIPGYPAQPFNVNSNDITNISQARNFLYLINPENYATKQDFINDVSQTDYDAVIMDLFHFGEAYAKTEIEQLKTKANGGKRLIIAYMSIGEAEDYRFYWQDAWNSNKPAWLGAENPDWAGNYKVRYWETEWKNIIYGNENSYLKKIIDAGFEGVYLDIVDAFEYFEEK